MLSATKSIFLTLTLIVCCASNKYSEDLNRPISELVDPFRINKVNLLWHKAKHTLSEKKLADLYSELKIHDKKEGDLKKMKEGGLDEDGLKAAQVEEKFMAIVMKYGLNAHYGFERGDNYNRPDKQKPQEIKDPKLKELWNQAAASEFSENELKTLKQEFSHHQRKLDEYSALKDEINRLQSVEHNELDAEDFDGQDLKQKQSDLKLKHKELKSNFDRLGELASDPELATQDFSDIRVYQLWSMARKSNMTNAELASLREELKHFEHRLKKQEYFQEQLSLSEKRLRGDLKEPADPEAHEHLEQKVKDYNYKVKKIHTDLKLRIEAYERHTEL